MKNTTIVFRNKFEKFIHTDRERQLFISAFEKFLEFSADSALPLLWKLTYEPNSWTLGMIGLSTDLISADMGMALRNELRYQYKNNHPDFLDITVPENCEEAFQELKDHSDLIVSSAIYVKISNYLPLLSGNDDEISRISYLLSCETENHYFGGIRALGFDNNEAAYLKQYHMFIHNLFVSMVENRRNSNKVYESIAQLPLSNADPYDDSLSDVPFTMSTPAENTSDIGASQECVAADEKVFSPEAEKVEDDYDEYGYLALTKKNIVENNELFVSFLSDCSISSLKNLHSVGFDLNEVVYKAEEIAKFVKAYQQFRASLDEFEKESLGISLPDGSD